MANTKKWAIAAFECKPTDGELTDVAFIVHWRKQATEVVGDKTYTADMYGGCAVGAPDPETFIPFEELTEEVVVPWIEAVLDVNAIDSALDAKIEEQKNPPVVTKKVPWLVDETPAQVDQNYTPPVTE